MPVAAAVVAEVVCCSPAIVLECCYCWLILVGREFQVGWWGWGLFFLLVG